MNITSIPVNKVWISVNHGLDGLLLKEELNQADALITDLDGTIGDPAKKIAIYDNLFNGRIFNPRFISWFIRTGIKYLKKGKEAETESWKEYINLFLQYQDELKEIEEKFSHDKISPLLYPGVERFFSLVPRHIHKTLMTKNITEVAIAFVDFLRIEEVIPEAFNKERETIRFLEENKDLRRCLVFEDYEPDFFAIMGVLDFYKKRKKIEKATGFYVADSKDKQLKEATVNIGKDFSCLADLLQSA